MKILSKIEMQGFVKSLLEDGVLVRTYAKSVLVYAVEASGGEKVVTQLADGTIETTSVAKEGDFIITNPDGERYVVSSNKFHKKYELAFDVGENCYKPKADVCKFLEIDEDITFVCSWGEMQYIKAGGFINITDFDDIYGVAKNEFFDTYRLCDENGNLES